MSTAARHDPPPLSALAPATAPPATARARRRLAPVVALPVPPVDSAGRLQHPGTEPDLTGPERPRARISVADPPRPPVHRPNPRARRAPQIPVPIDRWAALLAVALAETLTGSRPVQQLTRWLDTDIYTRVSRRAGLTVRLRGRPPQVTHAALIALRASMIDADRHEVSAVVHDGTRVRAMALRVERFGMRWRVTEAELG